MVAVNTVNYGVPY